MRNFLIILLLPFLLGCAGGKLKECEQTIRSLEQQLQKQSADHEEVVRILNHQRDSLNRLYFDYFRSPKSGVDRVVLLEYAEPINGYQVSVIWQPDDIVYEGKLVGKAILNFQKGNINFSMVHSRFFVNGITELPSKKELQIAYPKSKASSLLRADVPFFFANGGRQLIFTMWAMGQRRTNAYRYYQLADDGGCEQDDLYQITYDEPYLHIDDLTKFEDDKIIITSTGGACNSSKLVYIRDENGLYRLLEHIEQRDSTEF